MEKSDFLVTAIVSVYNAERFIAGCLEDMERQTIAAQMEIIVVDTGSPQNEGDIVRDYQQRFSNIRYIRVEARETIYQAWNRAIAVAQGKYLTNANADDRHRPDAIEKLVSLLEQDSEIGVAYADSFITTLENDRWPSQSICGSFHWPKFDLRRLFQICYIGPQPVWRRDLHKVHGVFDERLRSAGDYEFWLRLAVAGIRFAHLPEVLGLYLASPSGMELSNKGLSHAESEVARHRYWRRKWGLLSEYPGTFLFSSLPHDPLVTVVIPTLNRPQLLKDALASLIAQTYSNWEAVVVNDGGEDVQSVIKELGNDSRILLLTHWKKLGQSRARNTALRVAQGEIICYLDDDDRYLPGHLEGIVAAMRESPSPFIYTGALKVTEQWLGEQRIELDRVDIEATLQTPQEKLLAWNFIPLPTWAHRKECLNQIGFFDEAMSSHEDWDLLLRFANVWTLRHINQMTVEIRIRPTANDSVTTRNNSSKLRDFRLIYQRHKTSNKEIQGLRRRVLEDLGERKELNAVTSVIRRLRKAYDRNIGWRFHPNNKAQKS